MPSPTPRAPRTAAAAAAAATGAVTKTGRKADGKGKVIFLFRSDDFNMVCLCEELWGFFLIYKDSVTVAVSIVRMD